VCRKDEYDLAQEPRKMLLIVKGDASTALGAAVSRGAKKCRVLTPKYEPTIFADLLHTPKGHGAVGVPRDTATIRAELPYAIASGWLAEEPGEAPYPTGALLWYRED
jgi:hypothetical protein